MEDTTLLMLERLNRDIPKEHVHKHPYSGFSYIKSWYVIKTLNDIFGVFGWEDTIDEIKFVNEKLIKDNKGNEQWEVIYHATCTIYGNHVSKSDVGVGVGYAKKSGEAHDIAAKAAASDAIKRAARQFGRAFGLALYDGQGEADWGDNTGADGVEGSERDAENYGKNFCLALKASADPKKYWEDNFRDAMKKLSSNDFIILSRYYNENFVLESEDAQ